MSENQEYDSLVDIESIKAIYSDFLFTSPSIMYDKEAEIASTIAENGLLTNIITEINETPWARELLGRDRDWDLAANVNSFATECHLLYVSFFVQVVPQ